MSGYGSCKWTCGECGESYEASGVVGDMKVNRWRRDHREAHRFEKMTPDEQAAYHDHRMEALCLRLALQTGADLEQAEGDAR